MKKISIFFIIIFIINVQNLYGNNDFNVWLNNFKNAVLNGISQKTVDEALSGAKFLAKVIEYDRYQPEFYEDTYTYIKKRSNRDKVREGLSLYKKKKK